MLVPILTIKKSSTKTQDIDIAIISSNAYCTFYYLKESQVFAILINNI